MQSNSVCKPENMNIEDDEYYKDVKKVFQETPLIVYDSTDNQNEKIILI